MNLCQSLKNANFSNFRTKTFSMKYKFLKNAILTDDLETRCVLFFGFFFDGVVVVGEGNGGYFSTGLLFWQRFIRTCPMSSSWPSVIPEATSVFATEQLIAVFTSLFFKQIYITG